MDINGGAFGIIAGGVTNEWGTDLQTSTLTGDNGVQISGNATAGTRHRREQQGSKHYPDGKHQRYRQR